MLNPQAGRKCMVYVLENQSGVHVIIFGPDCAHTGTVLGSTVSHDIDGLLKGTWHASFGTGSTSYVLLAHVFKWSSLIQVLSTQLSRRCWVAVSDKTLHSTALGGKLSIGIALCKIREVDIDGLRYFGRFVDALSLEQCADITKGAFNELFLKGMLSGSTPVISTIAAKPGPLPLCRLSKGEVANRGTRLQAQRRMQRPDTLWAVSLKMRSGESLGSLNWKARPCMEELQCVAVYFVHMVRSMNACTCNRRAWPRGVLDPGICSLPLFCWGGGRITEKQRYSTYFCLQEIFI